MTAYTELKDHFAKARHVYNASQILTFDMQTAIAPGSEKDRLKQLDALAEAERQVYESPQMARLLDKAEKEAGDLPENDKVNLSLMRRTWVHKTAVPAALNKQWQNLEKEGELKHGNEFRKHGDWSKARDWYARSFDIMRAVGEAKQKALGSATPYDALLDTFSPTLTDAMVTREFAKIEAVLPGMIRAALERQESEPPPIPLQGNFSLSGQKRLSMMLAKSVGFDFNRGFFKAVDLHPCSGGTPDDSRFITSLQRKNPLSGIYSTIHEAGHAAYEQNTPAEWRYQPAGENMGMAIHETMSRVNEVQAGHTPEFFEFLEREMRRIFRRPDDPALDAKNLERLVNWVQPSFIRIEADEMTYSPHVILRHGTERDIIMGKMNIDDLPEVWNEGMKRQLGITPPNARQGHMQDGHWPVGYVGYFAAYTLGDIAGAQMFPAAQKARPDLRIELSEGNFTPHHEWLRENVHSKGRLLSYDQLLVQATGETLNAQHYLNHLDERFLGGTGLPRQQKRPGPPSL